MHLLRRYAATRPSPAYIGVSGEEVSSANRPAPRDKPAPGVIPAENIFEMIREEIRRRLAA